MIKTLVESFGGRAWVEDRMPGDRGEGSRFVVMLPAHDARNKWKAQRLF